MSVSWRSGTGTTTSVNTGWSRPRWLSRNCINVLLASTALWPVHSQQLPRCIPCMVKCDIKSFTHQRRVTIYKALPIACELQMTSPSPHHSNSVLSVHLSLSLPAPDQGHESEYTAFLHRDVEKKGPSPRRSWSKFTGQGGKKIGVLYSLKAIVLSSCL